MRLDVVCCLLFIGFFINASNAAKKVKKDIQNKEQVAEPIGKHSHHSAYKQAPNEFDEHEYDDSRDGKSGRIVNHNEYNTEDSSDNEKHGYDPETKTKSKHKKAGKKKSKKPKKKKYGDDQDFKKILENYDAKPESDDDGGDGGYKTSVRTEHYEVKKINPNARSPDEKYIIEGAYKVQETDPWGFPTTSYHKYDSPISKIAASILSKYDYTNFKPGESDDYHKDDKEEQRHDDSNEYDGHNGGSNSGGYEDYDKKKKSQRYTHPSNDKSKPNHDSHEYSVSFGNYDDGKQSQGYTHPTSGQSKPNHNNYEYSVSFGNHDDNKKHEDYKNPAPKVVQHYSYGSPNNAKNYQQSAGYNQFVNEKKPQYSAPIIHVSIQQPTHENLESKEDDDDNKNVKPVGYNVLVVPKVENKRVGYLTRTPVDVEYIAPHDHDSVERELEYEFAKEFGHLSEPSGHSSELTDSHHDYDSEWQKHIIDYIYGKNH